MAPRCAARTARLVTRGRGASWIVTVAVQAADLLRRRARAGCVIAALEAQEAGAVLAILVRPDPRNARDHESICIFHESIEVLERFLSNACALFAMQALHAHTPPPQLLTPLVDVAWPVFANVGAIRRGAVASVLVRCEARDESSNRSSNAALCSGMRE